MNWYDQPASPSSRLSPLSRRHPRRRSAGSAEASSSGRWRWVSSPSAASPPCRPRIRRFRRRRARRPPSRRTRQRTSRRRRPDRRATARTTVRDGAARASRPTPRRTLRRIPRLTRPARTPEAPIPRPAGGLRRQTVSGICVSGEASGADVLFHFVLLGLLRLLRGLRLLVHPAVLRAGRGELTGRWSHG